MAKINGSEAKLGVAVGSTWGTAIALGAGHGMCFESLEYNDNPSYLDFNTKGCGNAMKNHIQRGFSAPTLSITYHLKYGGNQMRLLAGLLGGSDPVSEYTAGQGDYLHIYHWASSRQFFTIGVQSSSATALEWASCYPVSATVTGQMDQPLSVTINFLTTERNNTPATNTYSALNSVTETTNADYIIYGENATQDYYIIDEQDVVWSDRVYCTGFTYNIDRAMEHVPEAYASTKPEPYATNLMTVTQQVDFAGLDDHALMTLYDNQDKLQTSLKIAGSQINSGQRQQFFFESGAMKVNQDLSTSISSDGINSASINFEHMYQEDLGSPTSASKNDFYIKMFSKDTTEYF